MLHLCEYLLIIRTKCCWWKWLEIALAFPVPPPFLLPLDKHVPLFINVHWISVVHCLLDFVWQFSCLLTACLFHAYLHTSHTGTDKDGSEHTMFMTDEHSGGYLKLFVPFCSNMMKVNEMLSQENSGSFCPLPSIPPFRGSSRKHFKRIFWTKTVEIKTFSFMFFPSLFNLVHNVEAV